MKEKIFHIILPLFLLLVDINRLSFIYVAFVFVYMGFMMYKKFFNELLLAIPIFGYSFGLFLNKLTGAPNLLLLFILVALLLTYRFFFQPESFKKLPLKDTPLLWGYLIFLIAILMSLFGIFGESYQLLKLQLLVLWTLIYLVSIQSFDKNFLNFNFEAFLIISSLLFIPHFSNAMYQGTTLSPKQVWDTFSVLDDGIRGYEFDIITATRIAGVGILAFIIYLFDFSIKKMYLIVYLLFFFIMLIICQTRQSIAALFVPSFLFFVYSFFKDRKNYFGQIVGVLFLVYSIVSYVAYTESKGVESRIVTSVEGTSEEGTGREKIWNDSLEYINSSGQTTGFGNFKYFIHAHDYPHNIFLEIYIEMGILATLAFLFIISYIIYEVYKVFFIYKNNSKLELFLLFSTLYYLGLAQFSVDLPRNLTFLFTFALFLFLKNYAIEEKNNESTAE